MKTQGYRLFEVVAWPAAAWCPLEAVIRGAQGDGRGAAWATLLAAMAVAMIAGTRIAKAQTGSAASDGHPMQS